jgi:two-component system response regulator NreC
MIRVVIADDHAIVRTGLRALINGEENLTLVGEAAGGVEALDLVSRLSPDILVLDISMPDLDGISVMRRLKAGASTTRILILTVHEDEGLLREAIRSGASGYILKLAAEAELITAIQAIMQGKLYVDPVLMRSMLLEPQVNPRPAPPDPPLTPREVDILKRIVQGYTNKQISEELVISVRTVEGHRANLMEKLGLRSRVELVRYAKHHQLMD